MQYKIKKSQARGYFDHDWLKTYHSFSFGNYYDPANMGYRKLRVINEDQVAPGHGFPPHEHEDMEIISIVLEGQLAHKDSTGTVSTISKGDIQQMSAGTGVTHSEFNPSTSEFVHFLQIWIIPDTKGIKPRYQQSQISTKRNSWILLASNDGKEGSLLIQQDVNLYILSLDAGKSMQQIVPQGRYGWLQVIDGDLTFNGENIDKGDGVTIESAGKIHLTANKPSQLLFFDLN